MNIFQRAIRRITSKLANLTPNVFYYSDKTKVNINDSLMKIVNKKNDGITFHSMMMLPIVTGSESLLKEGDILEIKMTGVKDGGKDIGNFKVTIERLEGRS